MIESDVHDREADGSETRTLNYTNVFRFKWSIVGKREFDFHPTEERGAQVNRKCDHGSIDRDLRRVERSRVSKNPAAGESREVATLHV